MNFSWRSYEELKQFFVSPYLRLMNKDVVFARNPKAARRACKLLSPQLALLYGTMTNLSNEIFWAYSKKHLPVRGTLIGLLTLGIFWIKKQNNTKKQTKQQKEKKKKKN